MSPLGVLRLLFLAAIVLCVWLVAVRGRWDAHLVSAEGTWIVDLEHAPVWDPPETPDYARFRRTFEDLPAKKAPGLTIRRVLKWEWMALDLLLSLWVASAVFGLVYLAVRGRERDFVLHCAFSVAVGLTIAAGVCLGLWSIVGGWGPPAPVFFGVLGLVGGIARGILTYRKTAGQLDSPAYRGSRTGP